MTRRAIVTVVLLALLSAAGVAVVLVTTPSGVGVTPDSVNYLFAADELRAGRGLNQFSSASGGTAPLTHWPPAYPILLAALGAEPLAAVRALNLLLFAANIALSGWLVFRETRSPAAAAFAALLMLAAVPMIEVHSVAWTEPLFLLSALLALGALARFVERPGWPILAAAGAACALAFVTRYAGGVLVAAGTAAVLIFAPLPRGRKSVSALAFAAMACLPMAAWLARTAAVSGDAPRRVAFHAVSPDAILRALDVMGRWILPAAAPSGLRIAAAAIVLVVVAGGGVLACRREGGAEGEGGGLARVLLVYLASYAAMLVVTVLFLDAHFAFENRSMLPFWPATAMLAAIVACCAWRRGAQPALRAAVSTRFARSRPRARRGAVMAACILLGAGVAWRGGVVVSVLRLDSAGYASRAWRNSPLVREVRRLPEGAVVYSNAPDALWFLAGRSARWVPRRIDPLSRIPDGACESRFALMSADLAARGGFVVCFRRTEVYRGYLLSESELAARLRPVTAFQSSDGAIYRVEAAP